VVFSEGEPDKNEYRKFKIRFGQGEASDTRMLMEILERRFKHSISNNPADAKALAGKQFPISKEIQNSETENILIKNKKGDLARS